MEEVVKRLVVIMLIVVLPCPHMFGATSGETSVKGIESYTPEHSLTLFYRQPVTARNCNNPWMEYALPIGTGELGAMVMGGIMEDVLQFNEKTFWKGSTTVVGAYQNFGYLKLTEQDTQRYAHGTTEDYLLRLDLETAIATASWTAPDGTCYTKEYLASRPAACIAVHVSASKPGSVNLKVSMSKQVQQRRTPCYCPQQSLSQPSV